MFIKKCNKMFSLLSMYLVILLAPISNCSAATLKLLVEESPEKIKSLVSAYEKSHMNTKIQPIPVLSPTDFTTAIQQKPDVFIGSLYVTDSTNLRLYEDLNKLMSAQTLKSFLPGFIDAFTIDRKLLGIPVAGRFTQLEYNKNLFENAGLPIPDYTWTWEGKFYEACTKLSKDFNGDGALDQFGMVGLPTHPNFEALVFSYGGSFVDKTYRKVMYTEKSALSAINFLVKIHQEKLVDPIEFSEVSRNNMPFINGRSAMRLSNAPAESPAQVLAKLLSKSFEAQLTIIPAGPSGAIPASRTAFAGIMKSTKNLRESVEFIKYLASPNGQHTYFDTTLELPTTQEGIQYKRLTNLVSSQRLRSYTRSHAITCRQDVSKLISDLWEDVYKIIIGKSSMQELINNAQIRERSLQKSN